MCSLMFEIGEKIYVDCSPDGDDPGSQLDEGCSDKGQKGLPFGIDEHPQHSTISILQWEHSISMITYKANARSYLLLGPSIFACLLRLGRLAPSSWDAIRSPPETCCS